MKLSFKLHQWTRAGCLLALPPLLSLQAADGAVRESGNYAIEAEAIASGAALATSANYTSVSFSGQFGGISQAAGTTSRAGFGGALYELTGVTVASNPSEIDGGSTEAIQLSAVANYDDNTISVLSPAEVAWDGESELIDSISAEGVLTPSGADVAVNTEVSFSGTYRGLTGSNFFVVLALTSDFEQWAANLGLPEGQSGLADDPFGTGVANLLSFAFNLDPRNPHQDNALPFVETQVDEETGESFQVITFRENAETNLVYEVERSSDAVNWTSLEVEFVSREAIDSETDAVSWRSTVSQEGQSKEFLRVKVTQASP